DKGSDLLHNSPTSSSKLLKDLSKDISFIWHGVNDPKNLEFFLKSNIYWAEGDLRASNEGNLVLRHDPFETHPLLPGEGLFDAVAWLVALQSAGKGIQIDIKEGGETATALVNFLKDLKIPQERLWFTTNLKDIAIDDYARLGSAFPQA